MPPRFWVMSQASARCPFARVADRLQGMVGRRRAIRWLRCGAVHAVPGDTVLIEFKLYAKSDGDGGSLIPPRRRHWPARRLSALVRSPACLSFSRTTATMCTPPFLTACSPNARNRPGGHVHEGYGSNWRWKTPGRDLSSSVRASSAVPSRLALTMAVCWTGGVAFRKARQPSQRQLTGQLVPMRCRAADGCSRRHASPRRQREARFTRRDKLPHAGAGSYPMSHCQACIGAHPRSTRPHGVRRQAGMACGKRPVRSSSCGLSRPGADWGTQKQAPVQRGTCMVLRIQTTAFDHGDRGSLCPSPGI